jgi:hypothetical protein
VASPADRWACFVRNIFELNPKSHRDGVHARSVNVCFREDKPDIAKRLITSAPLHRGRTRAGYAHDATDTLDWNKSLSFWLG